MRRQYPVLQTITFALLYIVGMTGIDYLQGEVINFEVLKRHFFVGLMVAVLMYFGVFKRQAEKKSKDGEA